MFRKSLPLILMLSLLLTTSVLGEDDYQSVTSGGLQRRYLITTPSDMTSKRPVVLVLHGGPSNAKEAAAVGFDSLAKEKNFIVVYPEAFLGGWPIPGRPPAPKVPLPDELVYIDDLIDHLQDKYPVDKSRIYVVGISNGGMFAHYLGKMRAEKFAAIASITGGMPTCIAKDFKPAKPLSVLMIRGTDDPLIPFGGGNIGIPSRKGDTFVSAAKAAELWAKNNGSQKKQKDTLEDRSSDGCRVERIRYEEGRGGSEVVLYKIVGGGHSIPGYRAPNSSPRLGRVCEDIKAVQVVGNFFAGDAGKK